jgi:GTPase involved in cell partitioning and DNA repair
MIGEAREKFAQIAGPQGGSSLNGTAIKAEAKEMITALETELMQQVTGGQGYTFIIG